MSFFLKFFIVLNKTVSNSLILAVNLDLIDIAAVCAFFFFLIHSRVCMYQVVIVQLNINMEC